MSEEKKTGIRKVGDLSQLSLRRNRKQKKTPSLFDKPMEMRTHWGEDYGTDLEMALTRVAISKSLRRGQMFDIKNAPSASRLSKGYIEELMLYQLRLMVSIKEENNYTLFRNITDDGFVMVDFDEENNCFIFTEVK